MRLAAIISCVILSCSVASAAGPFGNDACSPDCYVSTTGNDQTGNGTQGQPWKTLMKCFNEIDAGDTCWFEDGTYLVPEGSSSGSTSAFNEGWDLGGPCVNGLNASPYYCTRDRQNGGTAAAPKKFKAVNTSMAIWKRDSPSTPCRSNMLIRNNVDNMVFQGIKFANNQWIAENGAANITFTENIFMCPGSNDGSNYSSLFSGDNVSPGCTGWHVYNNLFMVDGTCVDNHCGVTGGPSFMHMYSQSGSTFENNDYLVKAGTPYTMEDGLGFKAVN